MVDTINFRIHLNRTENSFHTWKHLITCINNMKTGVVIAQIDKARIMNEDSGKLCNIAINYGRDSYFVLRMRDKLHLPSSEDSVRMSYDGIKKIIEFETSIPKFYFANNVFEIYPSFNDHVNYKKHYTDLDSAKYSLKVIKDVVTKIIRSLSNGIQIPFFEDIEVNRIDLTYGQIFNSKHDALTYLYYLKPLKAPSLKPVIYEGGIFYNASDYSYKVYHKGLDFQQQSYNKLIRENQNIIDNLKKYPNYFDSNKFKTIDNLDSIQKYADCILRHELRFSNKLMSYKFNSNKYLFNEKNRIIWNSLKWLYEKNEYILQMLKNSKNYMVINGMRLRSKDNRIDEIHLGTEIYSMFPSSTNEFERNRIVKTYKRMLIAQKRISFIKKNLFPNKFNYTDLDKLYKSQCEIISKQHTFFLKSNMFQFDEKLIMLGLEKFKYFYEFFQLETLPSGIDLVKKAMDIEAQMIESKNKKSRKFNKNRIKILAQYLKKGNIDELKKNNTVSKATYYRMKKDLKELTGFEYTNFKISSSEPLTKKKFQDLFNIHQQKELEKINLRKIWNYRISI